MEEGREGGREGGKEERREEEDSRSGAGERETIFFSLLRGRGGGSGSYTASPSSSAERTWTPTVIKPEILAFTFCNTLEELRL